MWLTYFGISLHKSWCLINRQLNLIAIWLSLQIIHGFFCNKSLTLLSLNTTSFLCVQPNSCLLWVNLKFIDWACVFYSLSWNRSNEVKEESWKIKERKLLKKVKTCSHQGLHKWNFSTIKLIGFLPILSKCQLHVILTTQPAMKEFLFLGIGILCMSEPINLSNLLCRSLTQIFNCRPKHFSLMLIQRLQAI